MFLLSLLSCLFLALHPECEAIDPPKSPTEFSILVKMRKPISNDVLIEVATTHKVQCGLGYSGSTVILSGQFADIERLRGLLEEKYGKQGIALWKKL